MQQDKDDAVSYKAKKLVCYLSEQSPQYMLTGKHFINATMCIIQYTLRWIKEKEEERKKGKKLKELNSYLNSEGRFTTCWNNVFLLHFPSFKWNIIAVHIIKDNKG